jgi:hypothetical protein
VQEPMILGAATKTVGTVATAGPTTDRTEVDAYFQRLQL